MSLPDPISTVAPALVGRSTASQRWSDLLFLHWRVDAGEVAPLLPKGLEPDVFDGSSWVGLIPFRLERAGIFGGPPIPYFGTFVEINVRLYAVDARGRRGVVFLSLEASRLAAVAAARAAFSLPYFWSRTGSAKAENELRYSSMRRFRTRARSHIAASISAEKVSNDPLADFLTSRWGLFTRRRGRTLFLPNHHAPWALYEADLLRLDDTLLERAGFPGVAARAPDSVLYSPGVETRFGRPD